MGSKWDFPRDYTSRRCCDRSTGARAQERPAPTRHHRKRRHLKEDMGRLPL